MPKTHRRVKKLMPRADTRGWALLRCASRRRIRDTRAMRSSCHPRPRPVPASAFAGYRFPPEVITLAVRWYLRYSLSYRDVEELLAERGIEVDHVSIYRWVQRFAPEFAEAARPRLHVIGDRWHVDETYLKVGGTRRYLFRAIDQFGQVIDVFLSPRRDAGAARRFSGGRSIALGPHPRRSPPTGTGSTPVCSTSWSPRPSMTPRSTRTTGSRPTTDGSRPGFDPCED
jgi:hypothetical protein